MLMSLGPHTHPPRCACVLVSAGVCAAAARAHVATFSIVAADRACARSARAGAGARTRCVRRKRCAQLGRSLWVSADARARASVHARIDDRRSAAARTRTATPGQSSDAFAELLNSRDHTGTTRRGFKTHCAVRRCVASFHRCRAVLHNALASSRSADRRFAGHPERDSTCIGPRVPDHAVPYQVWGSCE